MKEKQKKKYTYECLRCKKRTIETAGLVFACKACGFTSFKLYDVPLQTAMKLGIKA